MASTAYGRTEEKLRNEYEVYPLSVLKEKVTELGVSLPITWVKKEFLVSVEEGLGVVTCYVEIEEEEDAPDIGDIGVDGSDRTDGGDGTDGVHVGTKRSLGTTTTTTTGTAAKSKPKRKKAKKAHSDDERVPVSKGFGQGDVIRIGDVSDGDREFIVESVTDCDATVVVEECTHKLVGLLELEGDNLWSLPTECAMRMYQKKLAGTKKPYIDMLVSKQMQKNGLGGGSNSVHEVGFESLFKIMAGESVDCPLCLGEAVRPVTTSCVHVHCYRCMVDFLQLVGGNSCPVCRQVGLV